MSVIGSNILAGASGQAGYFLTKSLRFRSSATAYLNRTGGTSTNRKIHTFSFWTKYSVTGGTKVIASAGSDDNNREWLGFDSNNFYYQVKDSGNFYELGTSQVLRDPSAWYHLMVAVDTTQATSSNRVKMYINGVQVTAFGTSTYPLQNDDLFFNDSVGGVSYIGALRGFVGSVGQYDGYLAEFNFIDGQQLTPSSFGETSTTTGVWIPKKYTGTYGTNGFYLPFTDTTSTSTLGTDFSGNSNTWTVNNISLTSGSTYDSMTDVPTLTSATVANYCVLNPLQTTQSATAPTNGNLTSPANAGVWRRIGSTMQLPTTGKFYFEYNCDSFSSFATFSIGVFSGNIDTSNNAIGFSATEWGYDAQLGNARNNNTDITSGFTTATTGDILQLAYDASTGSLWFGKNNTWQGASSPNPSTGTSPTYTGVYNVSPVMVQNWATQSVNFGQQPFSYTPPTSFVALNTFNLPTPTIGATASSQADDYFNAALYSGNNSTQNIAVGFQPDFVWSKCRNVGRSHRLSDAVRGSTRDLFSDTTDDEENNGSITSFISTGFSLDNATGSAYNTSGETYVSWAWKANGTAVTNTAGTISSQVSANTTSGFSVVTYTGNGVSGATIGHGLGVAPSMIIVKVRDVAAYEWNVYHSAIGATNFLELNATTASTAASNRWNDTAPTSSVFSVGNANVVNQNTKTYVAYCFAQVAGYSAFGSYTGNGSSDGTFVYTGFRPRFVMIKTSSTVESWEMLDTSRNTYNSAISLLEANVSSAEISSSTVAVDILSNGFKNRNTRDATNASGQTYIYMAFAENPFKYANAR